MQIKYERGPLYFGLNSRIYRLHIALGRVFTLTVGQRKPQDIRGRRG
jgi:hypothetical protein